MGKFERLCLSSSLCNYQRGQLFCRQGFQSGHLTWALALITHSSSEEGGDEKVKRSAGGCSDLQPCMKWKGWGSAPLHLGEWLSANGQKYWMQVAKMNFLQRVAEFSLKERVRKHLSSGARFLWCPPLLEELGRSGQEMECPHLPAQPTTSTT